MPKSFRVTETMAGTHHFVEPALGTASDHPCHFRLDWGGAMLDSLNPLGGSFLRYEAQGHIYFADLTPEEVPCKGRLELDYLTHHRLTYELHFALGQNWYRFFGEKKDVRLSHPLMLIKTHTTCYGTLTDQTDRVISRSVLHFDPQTLPEMLASFRWV